MYYLYPTSVHTAYNTHQTNTVGALGPVTTALFGTLLAIAVISSVMGLIRSIVKDEDPPEVYVPQYYTQ